MTDPTTARPERPIRAPRGTALSGKRRPQEAALPTLIHAGMVVVADGTREAARRLDRVLTTDPGTGILRHAGAGYPEAIDAARPHSLNLPCVKRP